MRFALFLLALLFATPLYGGDVRVVDGDTLDIDGQRYRLNGIDAPERGQNCVQKAGLWNCGSAAANRVATMLRQGQVACKTLGPDPAYPERMIGHCTVDGQDIGAHLIAAGLAWAYRDYLSEYPAYTGSYLQLETEAKARGLGIWSGDNPAPWEFRRARWTVEAQTAPEGCAIKGNISDEKIYHMPWDRSYERTRISRAKGERWFCSEAEAEAAGWRRAFR